MTRPDPHNLSKRERQIMELIYQRGKATAVEIHQSLADPPSYSAVRGMLRVLEDKGLVTHSQKGKRNLYAPTVARAHAGRSAMRRLVDTFFSGSPEQAVAALIDMSKEDMDEAALQRLQGAIGAAREEGR